MTATQHSMPSTAPLPPSPQTRVLELYRHCLASGTWARCVLDCRDGLETITFRCKARGDGVQHSTGNVTNGTKKHVRPSRRRRNRRRRLAWLDKRNQPATPPCHEPPPSAACTADSPPVRASVPLHKPTPPVAVRTRAQKRRKLASSPDSPERERAAPWLDHAVLTPMLGSPDQSSSPTSPSVDLPTYPVIVWKPPANGVYGHHNEVGETPDTLPPATPPTTPSSPSSPPSPAAPLTPEDPSPSPMVPRGMESAKAKLFDPNNQKCTLCGKDFARERVIGIVCDYCFWTNWNVW